MIRDEFISNTKIFEFLLNQQLETSN